MGGRLRWIAPLAVAGLFAALVIYPIERPSPEVAPLARSTVPPTTTLYPRHGPVPGPPTPTLQPVPPAAGFFALGTNDLACNDTSWRAPPEGPPAGDAPAWTSGPAGNWLAARLAEAGLAAVPAGSAFVVAAGSEAVVYSWLGPIEDMGPVQSWTELVPGVRSARSRDVLVDTATGGGVRLWFVTQPVGVDGSGCPSRGDRRLVAAVAAAAEQTPYGGVVPSDAGRFPGAEVQWLRGVIHNAFGGSSATGSDLPGTGLPIAATAGPTGEGHLSVAAGGRTLAVVLPGDPELAAKATVGMSIVAVHANRVPLLGRPYLDGEAQGLVVGGVWGAAHRQRWGMAIENTSPLPVDLTGWALRDDAVPSNFFPLPAGFTLAPGARVTLWYGVCEPDTAADLYWCNSGRPGVPMWQTNADAIVVFNGAQRRRLSLDTRAYLDA